MKFFVNFIVLGLLFVFVLFITKSGIFYIREQKPEIHESEYEVSNGDNTPQIVSSILNPGIFCGIVGRDSNFVAGELHAVSFERYALRNAIQFKSNDPSYNDQFIYISTEVPSVFFYVIPNKIQANRFWDSTKKYGIHQEVKPDHQPTIRIGWYEFSNEGYIIKNNGFTFKVFDFRSNGSEEFTIEKKATVIPVAHKKKQVNKKKLNPFDEDNLDKKKKNPFDEE